MRTPLRYCDRLILGLVLSALFFAASVGGPQAVPAQDEEKVPCAKPYLNRCIPAAARAGAEVEIKGNRFGHEQGTVSFAPGVEAKIVTWEYKRVKVIVPANAESGGVVLTSACGEESNREHFNVELPEPE